MRKPSIICCCLLGVFALLAAGFSTPHAEARPQYLKQFMTKYPNLADSAKIAKCGFCHPKNKKIRLDYSKAVEALIGMKNQKNVQIIDAALANAEKAKGKDGKTFGEMIEEGKLPK